MLLIVATFPSSALFAQEQAQATPTRQNIIKERIEQQRTNYIQNLQEAKDIAKQYRESESESEKDSLRKEARNGFMVRLTNSVDQLANMQTRVENRIQASEKQGFDVSEASALLVQSQGELQFVLDGQETLETLLNSSELPSEQTKEEAKKVFELLKENFKNSRMHLIDSIQSLKETVIKKEDLEKESETEEGGAVEVETEISDPEN